MPVSPRTTTSPPTGKFELPEPYVNEAILGQHLSKQINPENFSTLVASNFLVALAARDRRLTRDMFEDVLVTAFNFQNRLVRISELSILLEHLEGGKEINVPAIQEEIKRHMDTAYSHQAKLIGALMLFQEMRGPEDPVS